MEKEKIKVKVDVNAPSDKVWEYWTNPEHIIKWNFASEEWECPKAENDLKEGGQFTYVMAAKDGSAQFDFKGTYTQVEKFKEIKYKMEDSRKVSIVFVSTEDGTQVIESFEAEGTNSDEQQRAGWQSILNNFKKYAENQSE